jgi:tetratricopeptide (TPR) repeat protein
MLSDKHTEVRLRICLVPTLILLLLSPSCRKPTYKVIASKEGYTHVITKGETLESIAERYYKDRSLGKSLGEYNGLDPLKPMEPGGTLIIPFDTSELEKIKRTQEAYVLYNRGTVLARTGQYGEASRYLESAVEADPSHVDAWYNLALTYNKLEKSERAIAILDRLIQSFPSEKTYHYSLGAALRQTSKGKAALDEFKKALEIDPDYREAQYAIALTFENLGRKKEARREWERYLDLDPDSQWSEEARVHLENLEGR